MTLEDLLARTVATPGGCMLWTGATHASGYGTVHVAGVGKRYVHRLVAELAHGPIRRGLVVLHSCDVRACCNPDHLSLGTTQQNAIDRAEKHRGHGQRRRPVGRRYW